MKVAEKAKGPALAGGAALLGLAGGVALNGKKRKGPFANGRSKLKMPQPNLKMPQPNLAKRLSKINTSSLSFGNAATGVARGSSKVGEVASQVQKAAELISPDAAADEKKRRK